MSTAAVATPKKKVAASKPKKPSSHPKYTDMIAASLGSLKERGGSSRQAILKYISSHYDVGKDERVVNQHLKMALRVGVKNDSLKQAKGTGASGSFRLGEKTKSAATAAKKPPAAEKKSPKKVVKKATKSPKKVAAKSPKKVVKKNTVEPKAALKPNAAAKPKKTPVKAKKSTASKPKKAAPAKKSTAKKA